MRLLLECIRSKRICIDMDLSLDNLDFCWFFSLVQQR